MKIKKHLILISILLFIIPIVYASWGVSYPTQLELTRGESGRFKFGIDANAHPEGMECTYGIPSINGLIISYDQEKTIVNAKSIGQVIGTITVSDDLADGTYTNKFCVSCNDITEKVGTSVKAVYCDIPLTVNIVSERTKENPYISGKPKPKKEFPITTISILIIATIIIAIIIIIEKKKIFNKDKDYYYKKKMKR